MWSSPDVVGLFSINVVSFSSNVVLSDPLFSLNSVSKPRMLSVRVDYVLSSLQIGLHFQKAVHELVMFCFAQIQFREPGCEDQRLARDRPEIGITSHRIAEPGIFELP